MSKKLPKVAFIRWNEDSNNPADHYLSVAESAEQHAELGEAFHVGKYVLAETVVVTGKAEIKPDTE